MKNGWHFLIPWMSILAMLLFAGTSMQAQLLMYDSIPVTMEIREAGKASIRIRLRPENIKDGLPYSPVLSDKKYPDPEISLSGVKDSHRAAVGIFEVAVFAEPLRVVIYNASSGRVVQELCFMDKLTFKELFSAI